MRLQTHHISSLTTVDLHHCKQSSGSHLCSKLSRERFGGDLLPEAVGLQTHHILSQSWNNSSLPKLHLGRSNSEALRPPPLIYCNANRVQVANFTAKEKTFWWRFSISGNRPPNSPYIKPKLNANKLLYCTLQKSTHEWYTLHTLQVGRWVVLCVSKFTYERAPVCLQLEIMH